MGGILLLFNSLSIFLCTFRLGDYYIILGFLIDNFYLDVLVTLSVCFHKNIYVKILAYFMGEFTRQIDLTKIILCKFYSYILTQDPTTFPNKTTLWAPLVIYGGYELEYVILHEWINVSSFTELKQVSCNGKLNPKCLICRWL